MNDAPAATPSCTAWSRFRWFLFRVGLVYLLGYTAPFFLDSVPLSEDLPYQEKLSEWRGEFVSWHTKGRTEAVRWTEQLVGLEPDPNWERMSGSGDRRHDYLWSLVLLYGALLVGSLWTMLSEGLVEWRPSREHRIRPPFHSRWAAWARWWCRSWVGIYLLIYGSVKVYQSQFPFLFDRLLQTYGDSSPMGLLWTFMGASKAYNVFSGGAEMLGGLLLLFHCTSSLGALVSIVVMANVAMLNFAYDVPVKLFSLHLLAFSMLLLAADLPRLFAAFFRRTTLLPQGAPPPIRNRFGGLVPLTLTLLLAVPIAWTTLTGARDGALARETRVVPLQGVWVVDTFRADGETRPPLTTDATRWEYLVIQDLSYVQIRTMSGGRRFYFTTLDLEAGTLAIKAGREPEAATTATLAVSQPDADQLRLQGQLEGRALDLLLFRKPLSEFPLKNRGFHWISEFPYNR